MLDTNLVQYWTFFDLKEIVMGGLFDMLKEDGYEIHYPETKTPLEIAWDNATENQNIDRKFVVSCLHYNGCNYTDISPVVRDKAWTLCDGFGKVDIQFIRHQLEYDWSHVRDSSPEAIEECADYLHSIIDY